jgi:hypothetical protein
MAMAAFRWLSAESKTRLFELISRDPHAVA